MPQDGAGNPLVLPSIDLLERGDASVSDVSDLPHLKGTVDAQVEFQSEEATTAAQYLHRHYQLLSPPAGAAYQTTN